MAKRFFALILGAVTGFGCLTFITGQASAVTMPKDMAAVGARLPELDITDDAGALRSTRSFKGAPTIFVPIYSHCKAECPLTVKHLIDATSPLSAGHLDYHVVLFSFDPDETSQTLRTFRNEMKIPLSWTLAKSSPKATYALMNAIGFRYLTESGNFSHPDFIAFLSPGLTITDVTNSSQLNSERLASALERARTSQAWMGRAAPYALAFGVVGLLFSVVFVTTVGWKASLGKFC